MQKHIFSKFYGKVGRKVDKGKKGLGFLMTVEKEFSVVAVGLFKFLQFFFYL